jgi:hypothetical protein
MRFLLCVCLSMRRPGSGRSLHAAQLFFIAHRHVRPSRPESGKGVSAPSIADYGLP